MVQDQQKVGVLSRLKSFFHARLTSRDLPVYLAILAVVLTLPSLRVGLIADDYEHAAYMKKLPGVIPIQDSTLDMFRFMDGDPRRIAELMDYGFLPWWTYEKMKGAFWRPVTSMTHWLDYQLWPDTPALMHAHSVLWFAVLAAVITFYYRKIMGFTGLAGLAALLYTLDDAHGLPVGFIANRNAMIAAFFGVLALCSHDLWRRKGWSMGALISPLFLMISLLSAEAGIGTFAYLLAYAVFFEQDNWRKRIATLVPYIIVMVLWRIIWTSLGYGVDGVWGYIDPLRQPVAFLGAVVTKVPILLLAQWAFPPAGLALMVGPHKERLLIYSLIAWSFVVLLFVLFRPLLRRDRCARFWALGMLLAAIPICAAMPSDRLLFFVGIGAMGLLAQFLIFVFEKPIEIPQNVPPRFWIKIPVVLFMIIHLVIAPVGLVLRSAYPFGPPKFMDRFQVRTPLDDSITEQDLILVNPPMPLLNCYFPVMRILQDQPLPRHMRMLAMGLYPVTMDRVEERTLIIRPKFGYLVGMADALFRDSYHPLRLGQKVELTGLTVEVTELTADHRPAVAAFHFDVPLEDKSLRWLYWHYGQFVPFTPPPIGQTVTLTTMSND